MSYLEFNGNRKDEANAFHNWLTSVGIRVDLANGIVLALGEKTSAMYSGTFDRSDFEL